MEKRVLVTGANGMIGNAVARAFVRAGWTTFGLVRKQSALEALAAEEIVPILGSPSDLSFTTSLPALDVIVSVTEDLANYVPHFEDVMNLIRTLATTTSVQAGKRPLVLFTSGCKDYGMTGLHGSTGLAPHTEDSPINVPPMLRARAENAPRVFEYADLFDGVVLRPTTIFGLSGSYYGALFDFASQAVKDGASLVFSAPPTAIMHGLHVDDCAEAYVALAEYPDRKAVAGQCFNISGRRYETLDEVAGALAREYQIPGGVKFVDPTPSDPIEMDNMVVNFPQWVGSDKIRRLTGWEDKRALFSEGVHVYRKAFEALDARGDESIRRTRDFVNMLRQMPRS